MVFSLDKDEFVSKIQFEDPSDDNNNTDLAAIALNSAADTFTYRGIKSNLVELPTVDLQQGDFLKVRRFSKNADGTIIATFMSPLEGNNFSPLVANMTAALNAQVCQLKDMVNTYTSGNGDGTDELKTLAASESSADQKALAVDAIRDMGSPYDPSLVGPPNGNAGQVADEIGRSYGDFLAPAVRMKVAIGDLKEAVISPADIGAVAGSGYATTQSYNLYYNVTLVDNAGTTLEGKFQSNIEPKFDQKSKVQIHAKWYSNQDMMPNDADGIVQHNGLWPTSAAHSTAPLDAPVPGNPGLSPAPTLHNADGFDENSADVLQAVSNSLGRFYGRIEWSTSPAVTSATLTKEAVNALVAGLIDVSGAGPKADQIVEIQNAMTAEIVAGNFKGLTSDTSNTFNATLTSNINLMGYNNGPSPAHTAAGPGLVSYSQVHQTCIAFSDSLP